MDLEAVRTVVAVAAGGRFQDAADDLSISQQAVSKRVAALERDLGVRLFTRTPRGTRLTVDGQAFLPHARALLKAAEQAAASVRPGRRALRVDVLTRRVSVAGLLRDFHRAHPEIALDVATLYDSGTALAAVRDGTVDATFRAVTMPGQRLPGEIAATPVYDEPMQLVIGQKHAFAGAGAVTPADLAGHPIWMPGKAPGTEWGAYYDDLAAAFGLTIDAVGPGPDFGVHALLDTLADSATLGTFLSGRTPLVWPARHDVRRIPLHHPLPVYPHSLLWHRDNPHPGLAALRAHLEALEPDHATAEIWTPGWALRAGAHRR